MDPHNFPDCSVCGQKLGDKVYQSPRRVSLTTGGLMIPESTEVFFCHGCAHIYTRPVLDLERYYDKDYNINLSSAEDDDLYAWTPERSSYRSQHQAETLLRKLGLPQGAMVLDYGCAKAASSRRIAASREDLQIHLFDVSENYRAAWDKIAPAECCATYHLPVGWRARFDVVYSFFVLEHVTTLTRALDDIARVLKPDGRFYWIVPNVFRNHGDLLVIDHINHFTPVSINESLQRAGFQLEEVDEHSHRNAFVITARKQPRSNNSAPTLGAIESALAQTKAIADGWLQMQHDIRAFESGSSIRQSGVIYGSGFYGTLIATTLRDPARIRCFLDQNPHRQGQKRLRLPIVAPDQLPIGIDHAYIGLNPATSPEELAQVRKTLFPVEDVFVLSRP